MIKCFIVNAVASMLGFFWQLALLLCVLKNVDDFVKIAKDTGHAVEN